jgi:hypothetical protein
MRNGKIARYFCSEQRKQELLIQVQNEAPIDDGQRDDCYKYFKTESQKDSYLILQPLVTINGEIFSPLLCQICSCLLKIT